MPARSRFHTSRTSRPNRSWAALTDVGNTVAAGSTKVLLGSLSLSNPNIDETILRTVGVLSIITDQAVADEAQQGAFGMILVTDRAIAAGAASIPGPVSDSGDDGWFVHVPFLEHFTLATAVGFQHNAARNYKFDMKGRRRAQEGQAIALMVETTAASDGILLSVLGRMLSQVFGT